MTTLGTSSKPAADTAAGSTAVACQGLSKVFKDFWLRDRARAVDNVSFHIDRGEIFGLLGPNGSGKSTTIKMLLGLLRPTKGRIAVFGKAPTDVRTKKRIGYLPEESYLYGFLDARETLDYYGKLFQIDGRVRKARIEELLDMVGLSHASGRPVRDYSKGMQRRIGIAQALINDPDLLILDEPTTGLDPIGTRQIKDLIINLGRRGKTVLLSSHLLSDVEDVVDRMVILYGGKIRSEGTCDSLLTATDRTTIETSELDAGTITEIDRIIRERSGGAASIHSVTKPRQKLEELFLDIVAKAQAERLATSGAMQGGSTAAFLQAGEHESRREGEAVIDDLLKPADIEEPTPRPAMTEDDRPGEVDEHAVAEDRLAELLADDDTDTSGTQAESTRAPRDMAAEEKPSERAPAADVDDDVIGSLLDTPGDPDGPQEPRR